MTNKFLCEHFMVLQTIPGEFSEQNIYQSISTITIIEKDTQHENIVVHLPASDFWHRQNLAPYETVYEQRT